MAVLRHERDRDVARHRVERLPRRLGLRLPVAAAPAEAAQPAARPGLRAAPATRATASSSERDPSSRTCRWPSDQLREVHVRVGEARARRSAAEVDRSGLASAVSCVPTPPAIRSPAIASAPRSGARVHRADDAVLEDHGPDRLLSDGSRLRDRCAHRAVPGSASLCGARRGADRPGDRPLLPDGNRAERAPDRAGGGRADAARAQDARAGPRGEPARADRAAALAARPASGDRLDGGRLGLELDVLPAASYLRYQRRLPGSSWRTARARCAGFAP